MAVIGRGRSRPYRPPPPEEQPAVNVGVVTRQRIDRVVSGGQSGADPAVRTFLNVRDSHATLIVGYTDIVSGGPDLALRIAADLDRPLLRTAGDAEEIDRWLRGLGFAVTLNVAGPRESEQPGAYAATFELLDSVLQRD